MDTPGTVIDGKYEVKSVLSSDGGMGKLLLVSERNNPAVTYALKYCLSTSADDLDRFRREVRIMSEFVGNGKVVQIHDSNLSYTPPYFVMPHYVDGDLRVVTTSIQNDYARQEQIMLAMADCVHELHAAGKHHRDIKPANFLRSGEDVVISDLGLGMDLHSQTGVTLSNQWGGTVGYIPPEFLRSGGFKNATPQSDIFMLGKTYYSLLTSLDPQFIDKTQLGKPLYYFIERCCQQDPKDRYQTIPDLKQGIVSAFDIVLGRLAPLGEAQAKYDSIVSLLAQKQYKAADILSFVDLAENISPEELFSIASEAESAFYFVLSQENLQTALRRYLELYHNAVLSQPYISFSYAETVADSMKVVFKICTDPDIKARALEIAIIHADRMNRYAAMSTCSDIITGIGPNDPAEAAVIAVLQRTSAGFVKNIEAVACKNRIIGGQIKRLANG